MDKVHMDKSDLHLTSVTLRRACIQMQQQDNNTQVLLRLGSHILSGTAVYITAIGRVYCYTAHTIVPNYQNRLTEKQALASKANNHSLDCWLWATRTGWIDRMCVQSRRLIDMQDLNGK